MSRTDHRATIAELRRIAYAAGDVIMIDKSDMLALADRLGVAVVGVTIGGA